MKSLILKPTVNAIKEKKVNSKRWDATGFELRPST